MLRNWGYVLLGAAGMCMVIRAISMHFHADFGDNSVLVPWAMLIFLAAGACFLFGQFRRGGRNDSKDGGSS